MGRAEALTIVLLIWLLDIFAYFVFGDVLETGFGWHVDSFPSCRERGRQNTNGSTIGIEGFDSWSIDGYRELYE